MRIIVMSDTHGNFSAIEKIIEKNISADMFIHLGDGERELDSIAIRYPYKDFWHVKGNCDYNSASPEFYIIDANGIKILATHGHSFSVKYSLENIKSIARQKEAQILLYGHTHCRHTSYDEGIYIMNPGSASLPRDGKKASYGYIDITNAGIVTNIVNL